MTATPRAVLGEPLDELERLARVTETGPWHTADALWRPPVVSSPSARFIAACSPERILQLVALARAGMEDTARLDWLESHTWRADNDAEESGPRECPMLYVGSNYSAPPISTHTVRAGIDQARAARAGRPTEEEG